MRTEHKSIQAVANFMDALSKNRKKASTLFEKLDTLQKLICVNEEHNALFMAIANASNLKLIKSLALITDPNLFFFKKWSVLKVALDTRYPRKTVRDKLQLKILTFILNHIEENKINFDVVAHMQYAAKSRNDAATYLFLNKYKNSLNPSLASDLFYDLCRYFLKPNCMGLLIQSGGRLSKDHVMALNICFEPGFNHKEYALTKKEILKIAQYFEDQKIEIPPYESLLLKSGDCKGKAILLKHLIKNCTPEYWQKFGEVVKNQILLDLSLNFELINSCFILNPEKRLPNSVEENLAYLAIRARHPVIHAWLKRGTDLKQTVNFKFCVNISVFKLTLAHYIAFYSTDEKLLHKLQNINSINEFFLMTPAHYAALAMPYEPECVLNYYNLTSTKMFNFNLIGSGQAFEYANLSENWDKPDFIGFTPLMYGLSNINMDKRVIMLSAIKRLFDPLFKILSNFPSALIPIIIDYIAFQPDDPNQLPVDWATQLISKREFFKPFFHELLINPLENLFDKNKKFVFSEESMLIVRNAMYLYTILSLMDGRRFWLHPLKMRNQFIFVNNRHLQVEAKSISSSSSSSSSSLFSSSSDVSPFKASPYVVKPVQSFFSPDSPALDYKSTVSWKEKRDSLIEELRQCYTSGSSPQTDLKNALQPFIDILCRASNLKEVTQCIESIRNQVTMPSLLSSVIDKYGLRQCIADLVDDKTHATFASNPK